MVSHPKTPILNCFYHLLWFYFLTVSECSCLAEEDFLQKIESLNLDPRLKKLLLTYEEVFGALPPPLSCKKLVQMDLKLKPEFQKT